MNIPVALTPPQSGPFSLADGRKLHLFRTGAGPIVVLLHGYLDSHRSFFRLFEALSATHTIFAPDQRGHGDSDQAADYSIAGFTADAIELIAALGAGQVHLAGHSLGGIVAQRIAAARPDLVKSLALISTARTAAGNQALDDVAPVLASLSGEVPDELAREFQASTTFTVLPDEIFDVYLAETRKVALPVWQGALAGLNNEPAPDEPAAAIPTLILWGEQDGIFSAADQAGLQAHFTASRLLTFPQTGHAPNWERPAETAAALLDFWTDLDKE